MSDCPVAAFLARFDNGDRAQLAIVLDDRTRNPHLIAHAFEAMNAGFTGTDILKHQHRTCACADWTP